MEEFGRLAWVGRRCRVVTPELISLDSYLLFIFLFFRTDCVPCRGGGRIDPSIGSRDRQIVEPPPITFFSKPILNCSLMAPSPKDDSSSTQPVVFTTQTTYLLPAQKFMIPTTWKRYQLSQLVNKALSLTAPVPFDFLVKGEILRGTLAEWCHENGVGEVRSTMLIDGLHGFG